MKRPPLRISVFRFVIFSIFLTGLQSFAQNALPLKGGENVLFIGNSLTAKLSDTLNDMTAGNGLPAFHGYRVQLWNETFETHALLSPEKTPDKFNQGENKAKGMEGYAIKAGFNSLWKKGLYDTPGFNNKGYITALEAIQNGTPEGRPWDVIILQGYGGANEPDNAISVGPDGKIAAEGGFMIYGSQLIEAAKAVGAQAVLYMAWLLNPELGGGNENPESYYNQNFDLLIKSYNGLAAVHDISIVPIGVTMRALSQKDKPADARTAWLIRDNVHPTACGHALVHYSLASALYGVPPSQLRYVGKGYSVGQAEDKYNLLVTSEIDQRIKQSTAESLQAYGWNFSEVRP